MKLTVSPRAAADLEGIALYIAADSPRAAQRVVDAIEARWRQLENYPLSGVARDDIAPGIRGLVAGNYLTLYRVNEASVEIVRVLHGARRVEMG